MISDKEIARNISAQLLKINAVKLSVEKPFIWTSGLRSPIYCDNRITLSYPDLRSYIKEQFMKVIKEKFEKPDIIAGVATGAIAQGALVAQELNLPFVYIRSSKKSHGLENKIEGKTESGQSAIIIEDLISTGKSSLNAVTALRGENCKVIGMIAIFTYDLQVAKNNFREANVKLITLSDYDTLINKALEINYIKKKDMSSLVEWRKYPKKWGEKN